MNTAVETQLNHVHITMAAGTWAVFKSKTKRQQEIMYTML
jgi:hypothetical protein